NPTNPLNMIGGANDFQGVLHDGQLFLTSFHRARVTFDGGQTWTTYPIPYSGYNGTNDPSVAFDADGTSYFAANARMASQNFGHGPGQIETADDVVVSHSSDGGRTWSAQFRVARGRGAGRPNTPHTATDKPYLTAWGRGNAIVTWSQINFGPQGDFINEPVLASVTHDGGQHWTAPAQISSSPIDFFAVPTVAADGSIYVAF